MLLQFRPEVRGVIRPVEERGEGFEEEEGDWPMKIVLEIVTPYFEKLLVWI
jgi:hypothetical protein